MSHNADAIRALLAEAAANDPKGKSGIADRLGVSRPLIARVLSSKDPLPVSPKLAALVKHRLTRFTCPYLRVEITPTQCADYANRSCPTSNARDARHWKACQACSHRITPGEKP